MERIVMAISLESLLAARLFLSPQLLGNRLFFLSNLGQGGHLSLYVMDAGGSVPEPLLPARIAVQNPELVEAEVFALFPKLGKLLLMLDRDGDENYQPMLIPLEGGIPEPAFAAALDGYRVRCLESDPERNLAYLNAESRTEQLYVSFQANLETGELEQRRDQQEVPPSGIKNIFFTSRDRGLLFITSLFDDTYGLGYLNLSDRATVQSVEITGVRHS